MSTVAFELEFKAPVTLRVFEDACRIIGVPLDDALDDPADALKGKTLPFSRVREFLSAVCAEPPADLDSLPVEQVEALGALAAGDFFLNTSLALITAHTNAISRSLNAPAYRRKQAAV